MSLTGIMDNSIMNGRDVGNLDEILRELKEVAIDTNKEYAEALGIPQSTAITCVKPSGTVSQLTDAASGIHARHSQYYVRTVRGDKKDPITQFMMEKDIPWETDLWNNNNAVFSFPIKSPDNCITRNDMTAVEQLEFWKIYADNWCEHKPSITVSVGSEEWLEVGDWIYKNFNIASGLSFLPRSEHVYQQAPYQDCSQEEYKELVKTMPTDIDWTDCL